MRVRGPGGASRAPEPFFGSQGDGSSWCPWDVQTCPAGRQTETSAAGTAPAARDPARPVSIADTSLDGRRPAGRGGPTGGQDGRGFPRFRASAILSRTSGFLDALTWHAMRLRHFVLPCGRCPLQGPVRGVDLDPVDDDTAGGLRCRGDSVIAPRAPNALNRSASSPPLAAGEMTAGRNPCNS